MGFVWAVFIGHNLKSSCIDRSLGVFKARISSKGVPMHATEASCVQLRVSSGIMPLRPPSFLSAHIIDDVSCVFVDWPQQFVPLFHVVFKEVLEAHGLPIKRANSNALRTAETNSVTFIGWKLIFETGVIGPAPAKVSSAAQSARALLLLPTIPKQSLQRTVGNLLWHALGLRPLLSIFSRTFVMIEWSVRNEPTSTEIQAVRQELLTIRTLCPRKLFLSPPTLKTVVELDASMTAGAVAYTTAHANEVEALLEAYQNQCARRKKDCKLSKLLELGLPFLPSYTKSVSNFILTRRWTTAFTHIWRRKEHINALEMASAVLALQWARSVCITGHRVLLLFNSLVTVGALKKWRSSARRLTLQCRKFAALLVVHDLQAYLYLVLTVVNPADGLSRPGRRQP